MTMKQATLWDVLGEAPAEMRKPTPPAVLPLAPASPEAEFMRITLMAEDAEALVHCAKGYVGGRFSGAHDTLWNRYITKGAVPSISAVPPGLGWRLLRAEAYVRITRTRLGWTSGYAVDVMGSGSGEGGFQHPNRDAIGAFMWTARQAAIHDGARQLWQACDDKSIADHIRVHFAALGVDVTRAPAESLKRRLIHRDEILAYKKRGPTREDRALVDPGPSEDMLKYERAIGLTDVDMPAPGPAPVPAPPAMKITFDMGPFSNAHMRDLCEPSEDGMAVLSPPFSLFEEDEFLGQIVHGTEARALLFQRPAGTYRAVSPTRYVLLRFWDDEEGIPHYCAVKGNDDQAVVKAIDETVADYRLGLRLNLRGDA